MVTFVPDSHTVATEQCCNIRKGHIAREMCQITQILLQGLDKSVSTK